MDVNNGSGLELIYFILITTFIHPIQCLGGYRKNPKVTTPQK